jgi:hypothetical protein
MPETQQYEKGKLYQIPLSDLRPDPDQPLQGHRPRRSPKRSF